MPPLTVKQILGYPNDILERVVCPLNPQTKDHCIVAKSRNGPTKISYEIHGTGSIKLVVSRSNIPTESHAPKSRK